MAHIIVSFLQARQTDSQALADTAEDKLQAEDDTAEELLEAKDYTTEDMPEADDGPGSVVQMSMKLTQVVGIAWNSENAL